MFRPPPPRGRVLRLPLIAALLCSVVVAAPAAAAVATEAPTEVIAASPLAVEGRDDLTLPLGVQRAAVVVTVTDAADGVASWTLEPPADAAAAEPVYVVDLDRPDEGSPPRNGMGSVSVLRGEAAIFSAGLFLDRAPAAPSLAAAVRDGDVHLVWNRVPGPAPVTYRLERATAAGTWVTIVDGADVRRHVDAGHQTGRQTYRVAAAVRSAGDGWNRSPAGVARVRIPQEAAAAPAPSPSPVPEPTIPALPPTPKPVDDQAAPATRTVAVAGGVTRAVSADRTRRSPALLRGVAGGPTLQSVTWRPRKRQRQALEPQIAHPRWAVPPEVAAPRVTPQEQSAAMRSAPLQVQASSQGAVPPLHPAAVAAIAGAAAMAAIALGLRRRHDPLSLAPGDLP